MATPILPVLSASAPWLGFPGLAWDVTKSPMFKTTVQPTQTGREARTVNWPTPKWRFHFVFNVLRDQKDVARNIAKSAPFNEFDTLLGFFLARYGEFDPFFITDPSDHKVANQTIMASTTAGVTDYQLVRTAGSYTGPVGGMNVAVTSEIRINGTPTSAYTPNSPYDGWIRFDSAPSGGSAITGDYDYYFKVRFEKDQLDFRTELVDRWEARQVALLSVLP